MIYKISITWHSPRSSTKLALITLNEDIEVNGYGIQSGFISDGGTVPFGFRNSFSPLGEGLPAFIAHDHRLANNFPRKEANKILYRDLLDCGVNRNRAWVMFIAVELYRKLKRVK